MRRRGFKQGIRFQWELSIRQGVKGNKSFFGFFGGFLCFPNPKKKTQKDTNSHKLACVYVHTRL